MVVMDASRFGYDLFVIFIAIFAAALSPIIVTIFIWLISQQSLSVPYSSVITL